MLPAIGAVCSPGKFRNSEEANFPQAINASIYRSTHPPSIYLHIHLSIHIYPSIYLSIYPSSTYSLIHPPIHPSLPLPVHLSTYLAIYQFISPPSHQPIFHSPIHPFIYSSSIHELNYLLINSSIHTSVIYLPIPNISIHQPVCSLNH